MALLSQKTGLPSFSAQDNAIVNYFTDGGFERGSNGVIPSGWAQYADGAVAVPVDGTGGSAVAQVTMLCTNSSPIRGTLSAVISKDANNRQGVGYSFDFTISNADKGITAGVNFELLTSANYVSGDMVFYIYDVTNSILITPRSVSLPALTNYGKFFSDYGLTAGTSYRFILHIATTSALAYTVTLDTMVNTTTRVAVPGAVVGVDRTFTPVAGTNLIGTTTSPTFGTVSLNSCTVFRDSNFARFIWNFKGTGAGTAGSGAYRFVLPTGLTIDTSITGTETIGNLGAGFCGTITVNDGTNENQYSCFVLNSTTIITRLAGQAGGGGWNSASNCNFADAALQFSMTLELFISEWSGSGSNFGPGASVEYLSTDFASFSAVRSSAGTALPLTTPAGTNEQIDMGALPWQNAQQSIDMVDIEIQQAGAGPWLPLPNADIAILTFDGTNYIGLGILYTGGTYKMIRGKYRAAGAGTWASIAAGTRYRVLKARPDSPVGQALVSSTNGNGLMPYLNSSYDNATATQLGLKSYYHGTTYNGGNAPTVSNAQAGFSHVRSAFVPYQMQDGTWRMKFNINFSYTATAVSNISGTSINGVVFAAEGAQAVSGATNSGTGVVAINCWTNENTNTISYYHSASYTNGKAFISGDVELESKPTWAY